MLIIKMTTAIITTEHKVPNLFLELTVHLVLVEQPLVSGDAGNDLLRLCFRCCSNLQELSID